MSSLSETLAEYVTSLSYEALPSDVVAITKVTILDWLGNAIAGSTTPPARMVQKVAFDAGGRPQATAIASLEGDRETRVACSNADRYMTSALLATLVNGTNSHTLELDDVHKSSILHAGTAVIPAALACAETLGKSGTDMITAVVAGFDVSIRIGEAVTPAHYKFFHNTGTVGTFGAAVAAAKIMGLSSSETVHALGSAGTQAAGLWEFIETGAMSKHLHSAKAGFNGLLSAYLAREGFTGAPKILDGDRGFLRAMVGEYDVSSIWDGLGDKFKIAENCFKVHASCRHTHAAIDLALQAHYDGLECASLRKIRIGTYGVALDITDKPKPHSVFESKFSIQFCVALALRFGEAGLKSFSQERLEDPYIAYLLDRIEVYVDPECESKYPAQWCARLTMETNEGSIVDSFAKNPKGDYDNPVSESDLVQKFYSMVTPLIGTDSASVFVDRCMSLESNPSLATFFS